jgi:hypothetical protein
MVAKQHTIRVFPTRTSMTPADDYSYCGLPDFFIPPHDSVHISVVFTWDIPKAKQLKYQWEGVTNKPVLMGGPAFGDPGNGFQPGMYLRKGITITSRGCPHKCGFCLVPKREGGLRELEVVPGNIIQDNNVLACSDKHLNKVFEMLKTQSRIRFLGGLESKRVTPKIAERLRGLKIAELWLSCDYRSALKPLQKAIGHLRGVGFRQNHLRVYVLIGKDPDEEQERLQTIYRMGALPFAQLYKPQINLGPYSRKWKQFSRLWSRPAAYKSYMKNKSETPK